LMSLPIKLAISSLIKFAISAHFAIRSYL